MAIDNQYKYPEKDEHPELSSLNSMSGRVVERNIQENRYAVLGPGPAHSLWGLQKY